MEQNKLQLLILSIDDSRYGIDIDQIAYLRNVDTEEATVTFEQLMGKESSVEINYSKMLMIKKKIGTGILINEPDEVGMVSIGDICRLPDSLMRGAMEKGVWGLCPQEQGMIILIDFYKNQQFQRLTKDNKRG